MKSSNFALIALGLAQSSVGQQAGWQANQINTTMCQWQYPRAAVIRDTMYIDGGNLWWKPGSSDGTYGKLISDGNPLGLVYLLNFSIPFNTSQNTTSIFTTTSKATGGGNANNLGPQYYDGAMFASDYEWIGYGGVTAFTDGFNPQPATSFAEYEAIARPGAQSGGYSLGVLPDAINRFVTNGASVSIPSENLGFYFAGTRAASWGPIYYLPGSLNESVNADQLSLTLIGVDMTEQKETWSNQTLPSTVPGRADPEIVWVPVSTQGVLVAIGGVIFPSYLNPNTRNNESADAASIATSPGFMTTVSVYDVATKIWYEQPTSGSPPGQLAQGCTVLASAQDGSSHNIYWYGGFEGLDAAGVFNDNVYVLSVPSFVWTKVYTSSNPNHARAGHRCTKPYPDQMFVVGGYSSLTGFQPTCVIGGIVQVYNLSSNTWMDSYDPRVWSKYSVPGAVLGTIGGTSTGGAVLTSPSGGFANSSMASIFGTQYDATKIHNYYPYALASPVLPSGTIVPVAKSSTPSYLAPVLGVVLGLFFITLIVLAIMLWRRRRYLRNSAGTQSEAETMDNRRWVDRWLSGTPAMGEKAPTVTTDESSPVGNYDEHHTVVPVEMDQGNVRYEMDATSKPMELHNQEIQSTGMTPITGVRAFTHTNGRMGIQHSNSVGSDTSGISYTSSNPRVSPLNSPCADSLIDVHPHFMSGVSNMTDSERGHLRGISETSVSTTGGYESPADVGAPQHFGHGSPVDMGDRDRERPMINPLTPPSTMGLEGRDYSGGRSTGSSRRRSNFSEELDEVTRK